jgi:hypothetical protein
MKPWPSLQLAGRPARPWAGLVLAALALPGLLLQLAALRQAQQAQAQARHDLQTTRAATTTAARPASEADKRQLAQARQLLAQLQAPWFELMAAFEQHTRDDIGLLRLEPDARAMRVRVVAQARDQAAMLAYLQALEADPRLSDVLLLNHQLEADQPGRPVRFALQAGWRRAAGAAVATLAAAQPGAQP